MTEAITLERLLTHSSGFGLTTASPLQRAICRIADGLPLGDLATDPSVVSAVGNVAALPTTRPAELLILSGVRTGKSLLAAALAVRASQTCDVSQLGPGDGVRVSVLSLTVDLGRVPFGHMVGNILAKSALRALLVGEPTADTLTLRHPSGREIEIKVVAGARAGASLVARWSAGVIFDEAPRMLGDEDGVVNFDDARRAALGRLLPGAQLIAIGSPWAPRGPIYEMATEHWREPTADLVVIRAPANHMNPTWWTKERSEKLKRQDEQAWRTDVCGLFADPETSLFSSAEIDRATRKAPLVLPRAEGQDYRAACDPATRGNGWTLVVTTRQRCDDGRIRTVVVLAKQWQGSKSDPLKPDAVCAEIATELRAYGLDTFTSDQWAADFLKAICDRHGLYVHVETITAPKKVAMFEALRVQIADDELQLPPDPMLRADLLSIRKRVSMNGIAIELPRTADGRHADFGPALAICVSRNVADPSPVAAKPNTPAYYAELERIAEETALHSAQRRANDAAAPWWTEGLAAYGYAA